MVPVAARQGSAWFEMEEISAAMGFNAAGISAAIYITVITHRRTGREAGEIGKTVEIERHAPKVRKPD